MIVLYDIDFRARTRGDVRAFAVGAAANPGEVGAEAGFEGGVGGGKSVGA